MLSPAYPLELSVGLGTSPLLRGVGALWEEDLKQMAWKASWSPERSGDGMVTTSVCIYPFSSGVFH